MHSNYLDMNTKKNCKHEYKEIDYQLKFKKKKEKKKHGIYNSRKENPVQTFTL